MDRKVPSVKNNIKRVVHVRSISHKSAVKAIQHLHRKIQTLMMEKILILHHLMAP